MGGLMSVNLKYTGEGDAEYIRIYVKDNDKKCKKKTLCKYKNVKNGDELFCDIRKAKDLVGILYFDMKYVDDDEESSKYSKYSVSHSSSSSSSSSSSGKKEKMKKCSGSIDTSCSRNIVGDISKECQNLVVVGWTDIDDVVCDEVTSDNKNAMLTRNGTDQNGDKLYLWLFLGICIFIVMVIGIFVGFKKFKVWYYNRNRKRSDVLQDDIPMIPEQPRWYKTTLSGRKVTMSESSVATPQFVVQMANISEMPAISEMI